MREPFVQVNQNQPKEMDDFLGKYNLPKLTLDKSLNASVTLEEIENGKKASCPPQIAECTVS